MEKCDCGSGYEREAEYDGRDIFLCYACPRCRKGKLSKYRPEVLDSAYEADEDIEADEGCPSYFEEHCDDDDDGTAHLDGPHPESPDFWYEPEFAE